MSADDELRATLIDAESPDRRSHGTLDFRGRTRVIFVTVLTCLLFAGVVIVGSDTVAFTAAINGTRLENLGAAQTILYDHVLTNVGGAYDSRTGVFTAPLSGVYVFNIDTMLEPGDSQYLRLMVDGRKVLNSFTHGTGETHLMTLSRTITQRLDAGNEVWVSTFDAAWHGNGRLHGYEYSSFSGWIVGFLD